MYSGRVRSSTAAGPATITTAKKTQRRSRVLTSRTNSNPAKARTGSESDSSGPWGMPKVERTTSRSTSQSRYSGPPPMTTWRRSTAQRAAKVATGGAKAKNHPGPRTRALRSRQAAVAPQARNASSAYKKVRWERRPRMADAANAAAQAIRRESRKRTIATKLVTAKRSARP